MPAASTQTQRYLTLEIISKKLLNLPAVWLKEETAEAGADDKLKTPDKLSTDIEEWRSLDDARNLGVRLVDGCIELRISSPDDIWPMTFFEACSALNVDSRFAFGTRTVSSVIFLVDPSKIEPWRERWPGAHRNKSGGWVKTEFEHSLPGTKTAKAVWRDSRPLPGSRLKGELVGWRPKGKALTDDIDIGLEEIEPRRIAETSMEAIVRAIAFATLAYWIRIYLEGLSEWDETLTRVIGGWLARLVREGRSINAQGRSLEGICWAPVDSAETAKHLIDYLGKLGADKELRVAFEHAESALDRNPMAHVPGWGSIETLFGPIAKVGLRKAFRAGLEIDLIEHFSDRYIYSHTDDIYVDRESLLKGLPFLKKYDALTHLWGKEAITIKGKPVNPFRLYSTSSLRTDVERHEFRPGYEPASIQRCSRARGILNGEDRAPDEYRLLNTFAGLPLLPIETIDPVIMVKAVTMLDRLLGLLTRDNGAQMWQIKKFTAHLIKYPHIKPQICLVLIGGQGIGKSMFGSYFLQKLLGSLAGTARASELDGRFFIAPFLGKLVVFVDEVRLESVGAINAIKRLVREDWISGEVKFSDARDYYILSRVIIASNTVDIGLKAEDAADRCNYYILGATAENMHMTDNEFLVWSASHKPFYDELAKALDSVIFRQHLMRYFMDIEVTREELEDLTHSSRSDENVVRATMSKAREVARAIVADARINAGQDITAWFTGTQLREAIKRADGSRSKVEASQVLMEFRRADLIETIRGDLHKFKWGYGKILEQMGKAHNLAITPNWDFKPGDFDKNDVLSQSGGPEWRGNKQRPTQRQERPFSPQDDPDWLEPE